MKKDKVVGIGIILVILLVFIVITCTIGFQVMGLASDPIAFQVWMDSRGAFGQVIMVLLIFLQVVIAWIPGEILEVGAGYAFGFWQGSFLVLLGSFLSTWFVLMMVRKLGAPIVYKFFPKEKIHAISFLHNDNKMKKYLCIAFLIPGSPKDILTYVVGLTEMNVSLVLAITTIARVPSVVTSTITGSALGNDNYILAISSFVFTLLISAIGLWSYNKFAQRKQLKLKHDSVI